MTLSSPRAALTSRQVECGLAVLSLWPVVLSPVCSSELTLDLATQVKVLQAQLGALNDENKRVRVQCASQQKHYEKVRLKTPTCTVTN